MALEVVTKYLPSGYKFRNCWYKNYLWWIEWPTLQRYIMTITHFLVVVVISIITCFGNYVKVCYYEIEPQKELTAWKLSQFIEMNIENTQYVWKYVCDKQLGEKY